MTPAAPPSIPPANPWRAIRRVGLVSDSSAEVPKEGAAWGVHSGLCNVGHVGTCGGLQLLNEPFVIKLIFVTTTAVCSMGAMDQETIIRSFM
eukprot:8021277-Pyramimonas_sp.AAC.1